MHPAELRKAISEQRAALGHLRRQLPKPGPHQTPEQARCAYWLERAARSCQQAEQCWDDVHSATPVPGGDSE